MNVLSMEAHLSRYLALNSGLMSRAANRKMRKKSSRISFQRKSFGDVFKSVACRFDRGVITVAAFQAIELAATQSPAAMQTVTQQNPQNRKPVTGAGKKRRG